MRNIKIVLEYDGTEFCGWQIQPNVRTVQEEIEKSLKQIFQTDIKITGAGRTDSGVHAHGQVANFRIDRDMPVRTIMAALNGTMPKDVRVLSAEEVHMRFNSRFDAKRRYYRYSITDIERAVDRYYLWCFKTEMNVEKMQEASNYLLGRNDFQSFCAERAELDHHFCSLEKIEWKKTNNLLTLDIVANRFIHSMVRIIVGTMVDVGRGYTSADEIPEILAAKSRKRAGQTAPAKGLSLVKIDY